MTEQKRPVLTLKRKTEGTAPVRSRKTIINVTTPPKWKVKKQKLAEKAAREAELAAKKAQARQALSIYLNLPTLDEAVNTLKPWWPGLFDGDTPRLLACGKGVTKKAAFITPGVRRLKEVYEICFF